MWSRGVPGYGRLLFLLLVPFTGGGCDETGTDEHAVVRVGRVTITGDDLRRRAAIEAAYGGDTLAESVAAATMINEALEHEVAEAKGLLPDREEINRFRQHVEQTSRAPEILANVRKIFGADTMAFTQAYLLPKLVSSRLLQYQRFDTSAQRVARSRIERAYGLIVGGSSFQEAGRTIGADIGRDTLGAGVEDSAPAPGRELSDNSLGASGSAMEKLASQMKPGELFNQVLETEYVYRLVRLVARDGSQVVLESLTLPKEDYSTWLRRESEGIEITIVDQTVEAELRKDHPEIWWLRQTPPGTSL